MPPDSGVGFAPADWALFLLTGLLLAVAFAWRPGLQRAFRALAGRKRICMAALFVLPILLRLLLLPHHPAPAPDLREEFSQLLLADTLLHGRLANPPHPLPQFFDTFLVLQSPSFSSMYPLGLGAILALGKLLSGTPWTGVLLATGTFCAACYWMLSGWVAPAWALLGGILAVVEFGPLCQWTNSYWGAGSLMAAAGCLVFGALPRLRESWQMSDALLLGLGLGVSLLTLPFEAILLLFAVPLFFLPLIGPNARHILRVLAYASLAVAPAVILILLQNHAVTHSWITTPEQLHRYQYGVPTALTVEPVSTPHVPLTTQQQMDYKAESLQHGTGTDTAEAFLLRLEYRVRYYRFFFLPPLYLALVAFCFALREARLRWIAVTLAIFGLGTNLLPVFLLPSLAAVTGLFVLASVLGLRELSRLRIRDSAVGVEIAQVLIVLCLAEFGLWYALHMFETPALYSILRFETWDSIPHENQARRRTAVTKQLAAIEGRLLVFVRYSARHAYQDEWVWNDADLDAARVVFARDLGTDEDQKLIQYYPRRKVLLLEPDGSDPKLSEWGQ